RKRTIKTSSSTIYTTVALEVLITGSGGWIRTIDLRVMSPTSCHCSTPRWVNAVRASRSRGILVWYGARTYSPSGPTASTFGAAAFHDPVRDGTGWFHGASRTPLAQGPSAAAIVLCIRVFLAFQRTSSPREALVHALRSPPHVAMRPAAAAYPVISWGTYRPIAVS